MRNEIDLPAVTELKLTIENDSRVYPQRLAIEKNLRAKIDRMVYDPSKAPLAWLYFVDAGAKLYGQDFPGVTFNRATRMAVAELFAREFEGQIAIELEVAKEAALTSGDCTSPQSIKAINVSTVFNSAIKGV